MVFFLITDFVNEHKCHGVIRLRQHRLMGSKVVKSIILDKIRENPNKKAVDMCSEIKSDHRLEVKYRTAWYGKERAREAVLGDEAASYSHLEWFCKCTVAANPDARIGLQFDTEAKRFERMFVSYGASMKGFMSCRPILFMDPTFITNKYKGMFIAASAKDANQGVISLPLLLLFCSVCVSSSSVTWLVTYLPVQLLGQLHVTEMIDYLHLILTCLVTYLLV